MPQPSKNRSQDCALILKGKNSQSVWNNDQSTNIITENLHLQHQKSNYFLISMADYYYYFDNTKKG